MVESAQFVIRNPEDLLGVVPAVFGFKPTESIVVCFVGGQAHHPVFGRLDIEPAPSENSDGISSLLKIAQRWSATSAILVAYSADHDAAVRMVRHLGNALDSSGIRVVDQMRVHGDQWTSVVDVWGDKQPATGHVPAMSPFRPAWEAQGKQVAASRDSIISSYEGPPDDSHVAKVTTEMTPMMADELQRAVDNADTTGETVARIARALQDPAVHNELMLHLDPGTVAAHAGFWRQVCTKLPDSRVSDAAAMAAFTAFLSGDGVSANIAVNRSLRAEPGHPFATTVQQTITEGMPPGTFWAWLTEAKVHTAAQAREEPDGVKASAMRSTVATPTTIPRPSPGDQQPPTRGRGI